MKKRIVPLSLAFFFIAALLPAPALAFDTGAAGQPTIISAGGNHTGFVDKDGTLWMWGYNMFGQLGTETTDNSSVPVKVLDNAATVSCGYEHTAAIKTDSSLWMWGDNRDGELGNGTVERSAVPVKALDNAASVSCGYDHTAAIRTDGTLWMWGNNRSGQLGNGGGGNAAALNGDTIQTVPVKVLDNVAAVSCGGSHTAAIRTDGTLWMWGNNYPGQLGNGGGGNAVAQNGHTIQTVPLKVMDNVSAVSCGTDYTAAIKTDGTLWMWGLSTSGQLGNGTTDYSSVPVKVLDNVTAVSCGFRHTAAIKTDGTLWMWGDNSWAQLGNGGGGNAAARNGDTIQTVPIKALDNVAAVSCGSYCTAAIRADGTIWTWGDNSSGQLGNNSFEPQPYPIQIEFMPSYSDPNADNVQPPAPVLPEAPEESEAPADAGPAEEKGFPVGTVMAVIAAAGAGAAGAWAYLKKKKDQA